jgi:dihydrofolate reductase
VRILAVTENITVDGSIEMLTNWFDPQRQGDAGKSDLLEEQQRQGREADALLVGRRTFEAFREYWPKQTNDRTSITEYLSRVQKYGVSSTLTDPQWETRRCCPVTLSRT